MFGRKKMIDIFSNVTGIVNRLSEALYIISPSSESVQLVFGGFLHCVVLKNSIVHYTVFNSELELVYEDDIKVW